MFKGGGRGGVVWSPLYHSPLSTFLSRFLLYVYIFIPDHSYCLPEAKELRTRLDIVTERLESHSEQNRSLRKRKIVLENNVEKLKCALKSVKEELDENVYDNLLSNAAAIPSNFVDAYAHKIRVTEVQGKKKNIQPGRAYCDEIRKFCLTLFSYSKKSYNYVRDTFDKCLPSERTIRGWLTKVDGSPGFSHQSMSYLKSMVEEKKRSGQKVG